MSVLEDLGYMSRAAFATDKLLHAVGLHGQSIFPMILGFGCTVPAIMASRTLKNKRDRIITVLVTPLMSCGAKLPIHLVFAYAFFADAAMYYVMLIYACGVLLSLGCAWVLQHTVLRGEPTPFVLELPPYRLPTLRGIGYHVWEKTWDYLKRAGGIVLCASLIIWVLQAFPVYTPQAGESAAVVQEKQLEQSVIGRVGRFIEPAFKPLGFNWKLSVSTLTGFAAKEVVVSTLGVLYQTDGEAGLNEALADEPTLTPLIAFAFMLFTLLIPPCLSALALIKAEIGAKWLLFEIVFLLALGWLMAFAVVQVGGLLQ
jgi:ferrous iron transport protein B